MSTPNITCPRCSAGVLDEDMGICNQCGYNHLRAITPGTGGLGWKYFQTHQFQPTMADILVRLANMLESDNEYLRNLDATI